jgi:hypothetical protein
VPVAFVMDVVFLVHDDLTWFLLLALFRMGLVLLQLLTLAPALRSRQGLGYWYLIPFFSLVYGPILLATRFGGTLAGVLHVRRQREKLRELERPGPWAGPDADLWRETELSPAEASGTA